MPFSHEVLYVGAEPKRMPMLVRMPAAETIALRWRLPGELTERADFGNARLIVVDGAASTPRGVVELVRRTRWLGYKGVLLVVGFGTTELDRVLAVEAGADAVREPPLTPEELVALATTGVHGHGQRATGVGIALAA